MLFVPAFLLMAQGALAERMEVPILHTRPSRSVKLFRDQKLALEGVSLLPSDQEGTIVLSGPHSAVIETKSRLALFGVQPRKVEMKLLVQSPLDHAEWKANLQISNNASWVGKEERTGTEISLAPRLNDDGPATVSLSATTPDHPRVRSVFRVKLNEPCIICFPFGKEAVFGPGGKDVKGLRITVTYVGEPE